MSMDFFFGIHVYGLLNVFVELQSWPDPFRMTLQCYCIMWTGSFFFYHNLFRLARHELYLLIYPRVEQDCKVIKLCFVVPRNIFFRISQKKQMMKTTMRLHQHLYKFEPSSILACTSWVWACKPTLNIGHISIGPAGFIFFLPLLHLPPFLPRIRVLVVLSWILKKLAPFFSNQFLHSRQPSLPKSGFRYARQDNLSYRDCLVAEDGSIPSFSDLPAAQGKEHVVLFSRHTVYLQKNGYIASCSSSLRQWHP